MNARELKMPIDQLVREQERQRALRRRKGPASSLKPQRPPKPSKRDATKELRDDVWYLAARNGQLLDLDEDEKPIVFCCFHDGEKRPIATELMHMEGGVGRRRERQSIDNCGAGCRDCNRQWDRQPEWRAVMAGRWAARIGKPIPRGVLAAAALKGWEVPEVNPQ